MLATQVSYWTLQESIRHNVATEDLGNRTLSENIRHNVVTENETQRHNVAQEDYWNNSLSETVRHNLATEALGAGELDVAYMNAFTNQRNAATNEQNAATNVENARSNAANAATNAYNARTSRFGTYANYNLGLDANRISQQNADTRFLEYGNSSRQTSTAAENAATNALNAATNARQASVSEGSLNLSQERFQWQKFTDAADLAIKGANTANNVLDNVLQFLDN